LEVVRGAMVVAVARRTFRRGDPLPRVRALHFFLPVIDELLEFPCEPGYVRYLEHKLQPLIAEKVLGTATQHQVSNPVEGLNESTISGEGVVPLLEAPSSGQRLTPRPKHQESAGVLRGRGPRPDEPGEGRRLFDREALSSRGR